MNQIKPYLFWVVIGLILFVELAWWTLSIPDIDVVGNKAEAQQAKKTLDDEYKHLEQLDKRAKSGSPTGVFDAEKEADIRNLTDNYLITPEWKKVLDPHVKRYEEQLIAVKKHLAARSVSLRKPIAESTDKFAWYTAYQNASEAQLKLLYEANAIVLPTTASTSRAAAPGGTPPGAPAGGIPGGVPPTAGGTTPTATTDSTGPDFSTDASLRAIAGFFTKGADLPDPTQHEQLSRQFRTLERIIAVVAGTSAADLANPLAGVEDQPTAGRSSIAGVTWATDAASTVIGGEAGGYATGWTLTLTLHGAMSAIMSTMAALEHPHEATSPLMDVVSVDISRKPTFVAGERKDVGSELVVARITLLVLDFTDAPKGTQPVAVLAPGAPGKPGVNGMPPGMNGMPPGMMAPGGLPGASRTGPPPGQQPRPQGAPSTRAEQGE